MKRTACMVLATGMVALLAACAGAGGFGKSPIEGVEGSTAYTQRNLWVIEGEHEATNYRVGDLVPVNTKVRIADTSDEAIEATVVDSGRRLVIINVPGYTKKDMQAIHDRYFGAEPVALDRFSADEREAIEQGRLERGMSKEAVLIARGYPPAHETPSTASDEWRFWNRTHDTVLVRFDEGRVASIKD